MTWCEVKLEPPRAAGMPIQPPHDGEDGQDDERGRSMDPGGLIVTR